MKEKRGGKEIYLSVWLDGFVEGKLVRPRCFLPGPTKMFSPHFFECLAGWICGRKTSRA